MPATDAISPLSTLADAHAFLEKTERLSRTGSWILDLGEVWTMACSRECYRGLALDEGTAITVELFFSLVHPDDRERVEATMALALVEHREYELEYRVVCGDGTVKSVHAWGEAEYDDAGVAVRVLGVAQDITERKLAEEERTYASRHDELTGLPNRAMAVDLVDLARDGAATRARSVIVVALDIDDFTVINDTHGHATGNAVLIAVARSLQFAFDSPTTVARTGSDEFVVIGDVAADGEDAASFVQRVRDALRAPVCHLGTDVFVYAHIGVTVDPPTAPRESHLRNADIALAHAKKERSGLGIAYFNTEMRRRTDERLTLVSDLHHALEQEEFELRYQPIVRLGDDSMAGVEALIRWRHPVRGPINPVDFIPLAEDTGLIVDIGAWVINEACAELARFAAVDPTLGMSINVSVKQLRSAGIVSTVTDAVRRSGIAPGRVTIEMTESVFADDLDAIGLVLTELRGQGIRIAIDDFGTGFSSLAYLKHLPLDTLKIDKTFIDGLGTDPGDAAIVASALSISRALGLFAVAEGIETPEQLAVLRALGCDAGQGFYFSRPITAGAVTALLAERRATPDALSPR